MYSVRSMIMLNQLLGRLMSVHREPTISLAIKEYLNTSEANLREWILPQTL